MIILSHVTGLAAPPGGAKNKLHAMALVHVNNYSFYNPLMPVGPEKALNIFVIFLQKVCDC